MLLCVGHISLFGPKFESCCHGIPKLKAVAALTSKLLVFIAERFCRSFPRDFQTAQLDVPMTFRM
jgi:hypothetical protein